MLFSTSKSLDRTIVLAVGFFAAFALCLSFSNRTALAQTAGNGFTCAAGNDCSGYFQPYKENIWFNIGNNPTSSCITGSDTEYCHGSDVVCATIPAGSTTYTKNPDGTYTDTGQVTTIPIAVHNSQSCG